MHDLESRLKAALERMEAPEGFAEKVLRARQQPCFQERHRVSWLQRSWLAAAVLVLGISGILGMRIHRQRVAQAQAEAQLRLALEITSRHLNAAFERVNHEKENP